MKIPNKRELQHIANNQSSDSLQSVSKKLQKYTAKLSSLLVYYLTLPSDNTMHFKQHLLEIKEYK